MNSSPLVSAIVIFLNAEKYIEEAIESVFAQTYQDWELLLCDDGSTDDSTEIARQIADLFPHNVHYFEHDGHQNRGMSASRNLGIKNAKGEYISWLDSDDVWQRDKLKRQVHLLNEHPDAAMVYGPLNLWFSWTEMSQNTDGDQKQDIGLPPGELLQPPRLLIHFIQDDRYIPNGALVRRSVLTEVGGYEESFRGDYEDVIVHAKVCLRWPVLTSAESWYQYRQHSESYCAQISRIDSTRNRIKFLNWLARYLREQGDENGELKQVLKSQINSNRNLVRGMMQARIRRSVKAAMRGRIRHMIDIWGGS